jgi:hypothetical protein
MTELRQLWMIRLALKLLHVAKWNVYPPFRRKKAALAVIEGLQDLCCVSASIHGVLLSQSDVEIQQKGCDRFPCRAYEAHDAELAH